MIRFYMDENVHGAIVKALIDRGIDVLRVQDVGYMGYPDDVILDHATQLGRVLFSQDDDLLREATRRQRDGRTFFGVVYAHQQTVPIGQCVNDLELLGQVGEPDDFGNQVYHLPL